MDVRDVHTLYLIGADYIHASGQVRIINLVLRVWVAGIRPRCHASKLHHAHQPLHPLAVDLVPQATQANLDLAAAVKRMSGVFGINQRQ